MNHACHLDEDLWLDYIEEALDPSQQKDLSVHLKSCGHCQKVHHNLVNFRKGIRHFTKVKTPKADFFESLESKIMASLERPVSLAEVPTISGAGGHVADEHGMGQMGDHNSAQIIELGAWQKRFMIPAAAAAAFVALVLGGLFKTSPINTSLLAKQGTLEEQFLVQTASNDPQYFEMIVDHQDSDDLVTDAAVEKISHMSDADATAALESIK